MVKSQRLYNTQRNDATPISRRVLGMRANLASRRRPLNLDNSNGSRNLASGAAKRKTTHGKTAQQKTQSVTSARKKGHFATVCQSSKCVNAVDKDHCFDNYYTMGEVSSNRKDFWSSDVNVNSNSCEFKLDIDSKVTVVGDHTPWLKGLKIDPVKSEFRGPGNMKLSDHKCYPKNRRKKPQREPVRHDQPSE